MPAPQDPPSISPPAPADRTVDLVPTQHGYDIWAEIYDAEDNPLVALEERLLAPLLGDVRGLCVVDVGCGTGRHALRYAAAGARVTALDFSGEMLAKARAKPGAERVRFIHHDLARPLPLEPASFDRVVCGLVIDHIADLALLFAEMRRVCRPSGFVAASVMHPAMMLRGVQARFTDPATGRETRPASCIHQISDYVTAVLGAGLRIEHMSEHVVDEEAAARSPRSRKHLGWPLLLLMRLGV